MNLSTTCVLIKSAYYKKFKQYRRVQRRKQAKRKITLKHHAPNQPSLTLGEHHFRHLPMHEKMLTLSSSRRWCTSGQFSFVPWVVFSFKCGFKPVFAYYVPVYFFFLLYYVCIIANVVTSLFMLILKSKAMFSLLFSLIWGRWILPHSYLPYLENFLSLLRTTL